MKTRSGDFTNFWANSIRKMTRIENKNKGRKYFCICWNIA